MLAVAPPQTEMRAEHERLPRSARAHHASCTSRGPKWLAIAAAGSDPRGTRPRFGAAIAWGGERQRDRISAMQ